MLERECPRMSSPVLKRLAALALATLVLSLVVAPRAAAAGSVQGKLAPSPNPATPAAALWHFGGPGDSSTVTLTLTYSPSGNAVDAPTGHTFDQLIGFNVYGEDGQLFGSSTLESAGTATWSFQSTSVHQYDVKVFSYVESSPVTYTLAPDNTTVTAPVTPTPTPSVLVPRVPAAAPTVAATNPPASAVSSAPPTPTASSSSIVQLAPLPAAAPPGPAAPPPTAGVLAKAGDQVQGRLVGAITGATAQYRVVPPADGSSITLRLSAQQGTLIQNLEATLDVYQMQGGVKVLIAVGLPMLGNFSVASVTFPGGANGYGDYLAVITNSAPGQPLDFTLARR